MAMVEEMKFSLVETYIERKFLKKVWNTTGIGDFVSWPRIQHETNGAELSVAWLRGDA